MKKKILFVLILAVLFSACKMKLSENIGTVVIDFGGNERAVDENGLPYIKDASMNLEINSTSKGIETFKFGAGEVKTWSGSFPADEKLTIKVSLSTASAVWKGSAEHTVTEGINTVSIKLKKSAAALNSLRFSLTYTSQHVYTLTLKIGSKEIEKEGLAYHRLCRDNKGRTYLAYKDNNEWKLERYTSEGVKEEKDFSVPANVYLPLLAGDYSTGNVYLTVKLSGGAGKIFRIEEDGTNTELTGNINADITKYAVYKNVVIAVSDYSGAGRRELKMYRINGNSFSEIPLSKSPDLNKDTKIDLGGAAAEYVAITDLYMIEDSLYLLFSDTKHSDKHYFFGGIVKYSYTAGNTIGTIDNPQRIGIKDSHTADTHGIYTLEDEKKEFYYPVKVVGFDEENLYIGDYGVKFEFKNGAVRITANKNRIAVLKKADNSLSFEDTDAKWFSDQTVLESDPKAYPLVFFRLGKTDGDKLDELFLSDNIKGPSIGISSNIALDTDNLRNIFYTFDRDNNFYLGTADKLMKFIKSGNYREDPNFKGNYDASSSPFKKPVYDIAAGILYAIGENDKLFEYRPLSNDWVVTNSVTIAPNDLYSVYNATAYISSLNQVGVKIEKFDGTRTKVNFPNVSDYNNTSDIFVIDNICYMLVHKRDKTKAAIAYFDITKVDELPIENSVPYVPNEQIINIPTEDNNIYRNYFNGLKFTGYKDGKLCIALDRAKKIGNRVFENLNGAVQFDMDKKRLDNPEIIPQYISWFAEQNLGTKILVWKKNPDGYGFDYYQLDYEDDKIQSSSEAFKPGNGPVSDNNKFTDVFCYDTEGNLYIVKYERSAGSGEKYSICRFDLQDDGSHNTNPAIAKLYSSAGSPLGMKPTSIAVVIHYFIIPTENILYYSYGNRQGFIKRLEWRGNDGFANSQFNSSWEMEGPVPTDDYTEFTALAANYRGLVVGEFHKLHDNGNNKYEINVKRYEMGNQDYNNPNSTLKIVDKTPLVDGIKERLTDFSDGASVYALTTKELRNETDSANHPKKASISGKLWYIDTDFTGNATVKKPLYSSEPDSWPGSDDKRKEGGKFAPYRFIALGRDSIGVENLVIASDGFYGYMEGGTRKAEQYNFIWTFDLYGGNSIAKNGVYDKEALIPFSKDLKNDLGFTWE